ERPASALVNPKPLKDVVALPFGKALNAYIEGAWFVGYVLYRYGPERFISLYGRLSDASASFEQIASSFESVYGEALEDVWNSGLASSYSFRCVNAWKCSGPALALDGSPQGVSEACDGSDNSRTFQLNAETDVLMSIDGPFVFAPMSCDPAQLNPAGGDEDGVVTENTVAPLGSGKYFVQSIGYQPASFGIRALRDRVYSKDCIPTEPIELSLGAFPRGAFKLAIPNDGSAWYVRLRPPKDDSVLWTQYPGLISWVDECLSCGTSPDCHAVDEEAQPNADGNVTLRITSATPRPGYVTTHFRF
ncbi:MAG TPA: hypothetical protein VIV60_25370, partial [Polyangiaceae bacterium]